MKIKKTTVPVRVIVNSYGITIFRQSLKGAIAHTYDNGHKNRKRLLLALKNRPYVVSGGIVNTYRNSLKDDRLILEMLLKDNTPILNGFAVYLT